MLPINRLKRKITIVKIGGSDQNSVMKNLPTFRQLRFLVAVVDRCHFGKAAEDCFVSQSTLSAGVQELEELFGIILLERTKRSVTPTAVGIEIAERARALLKDGEDLVDIALAAQDPMSGASSPGLDRHETTGYARALARAAPPVDDVHRLGPADAPLALVRGRHRLRLLVKAPRAFDLSAYLRDWLAAAPQAKGSIKLDIDVDPQSFVT